MNRMTLPLAATALALAYTAPVEAQILVLEDLTTWSAAATSGSVVTSPNLATLTATSTLSKTVLGVTSFDWQFQAQDFLPFNDSAFVSVNGVTSILSDIVTVGDFGDSGLQTFSFVQPFTGTLAFGVSNFGDESNPSQLFVQNVVAAVPEPGTYALLLAGLGAMGALARRLRRPQAARRCR